MIDFEENYINMNFAQDCHGNEILLSSSCMSYVINLYDYIWQYFLNPSFTDISMNSFEKSCYIALFLYNKLLKLLMQYFYMP